MVAKEPSLLLGEGRGEGSGVVAAKIRYLIAAVGESQCAELMNLLLRQPELLLRKAGGYGRLEYLCDSGMRGPVFDADGGGGDESEMCAIDEKPLLVGKIPAVLKRDAAVMAQPHPFYGGYVRAKVKGSGAVKS